MRQTAITICSGLPNLTISLSRIVFRGQEIPKGSIDTLKVVGNEKKGVGSLATVRIWYRTVAIDVCLYFYKAVVVSSMYFRFLFVMRN